MPKTGQLTLHSALKKREANRQVVRKRHKQRLARLRDTNRDRRTKTGRRRDGKRHQVRGGVGQYVTTISASSWIGRM